MQYWGWENLSTCGTTKGNVGKENIFLCLNVIIIISVILSGRRRRKNKRVKEEENNEIDLAHADFEDSELVSDLNESKHIFDK